MSTSLVKLGTVLTPRSWRVHPLGAEGILETLVTIADEMDSNFDSLQLITWFNPFECHFSYDVTDICLRLGVNEPHEEWPSRYERPLWSFNKQRNDFSLGSLKKLVSRMTISNEDRFSRMSEDEKVMLVSFHINYSMGQSKKYYDSAYLPEYFRSYRDAGPTRAKILAGMHETAYKAFGMKDTQKVSSELRTILEKSRITAADLPIPIFGAPWNEDVFEYKGRPIGLPRDGKTGKIREAHTIDLVWGMGLYALKPIESIGYVQFNSKVNCKLLSP